MARMADVARLANVSLSTVSYALSGTRPISKATVERVRLATNQLGYRHNVLARGLAGGQTRIVALAVPVVSALSATTVEFITAATAAASVSRWLATPWGRLDARAASPMIEHDWIDMRRGTS